MLLVGTSRQLTVMPRCVRGMRENGVFCITQCAHVWRSLSCGVCWGTHTYCGVMSTYLRGNVCYECADYGVCKAPRLKVGIAVLR